jgi:hypothetical protein
MIQIILELLSNIIDMIEVIELSEIAVEKRYDIS